MGIWSRTANSTRVWLRRLLWAGAGLLLAWLTLFATLQWLILPRISWWQPHIEQWAHDQLGVRLRMGQVTLGDSPWVAQLRFDRVELLQANGELALTLPKVEADISLGSILRFNFNRILLESPDVVVSRDEHGVIRVAGIEWTEQPQDTSPALDWLFSQSQVQVRNGRLTWQDAMRPQLEPLVLDQIQVTLHNLAKRHRLQASVIPSVSAGQPWTLDLDVKTPLLNGHSGQWRQWSGDVAVNVPQVDIASWMGRLDVEKLPSLRPLSGLGRWQATFNIEAGRVVDSRHEWAMQDMAWQIQPGRAPVAALQSSGAMSYQDNAQQWVLNIEPLVWVAAHQPPMTLKRLHWVKTKATQPQQVQQRFELQGLDLAAWGSWLHDVWPDHPWTGRWPEWQLQGQVETLQVEWKGDTQSVPLEWKSRAKLNQVAWLPGVLPEQSAPTDWARPGVSGLSLDWQGDQNSGQITAVAGRGVWTLPGVWHDPRFPLDELKAEFQWRRVNGLLEVSTRSARFANSDFAWTVDGRWQAGVRGLGELDLDMRSAQVPLAKLGRYLPRVAGDDAHQYLSAAILQGEGLNTRIRIRGAVDDIPFHRNPKSGEFSITSEVRNVRWQTVPTYLEAGRWPGLQQLSGEFDMNRQRIRLQKVRAQSGDRSPLQLNDSMAEIADVMSASPVLQVDVKAQGGVGAVLKLVQGTQLNDLLGQALAQASGEGTSSLLLKMELPLLNAEKTRVEGQFAWRDAELKWSPQLPTVSALQGKIDFTESSLRSQGVKGQTLGGEVHAQLDWPAANQPLRLAMQGHLQAQALTEWGQDALWGRFTPVVSGYTSFLYDWVWQNGKTSHWNFRSDLKGLAIEGPEPFQKSATTSTPLRIQGQPMAQQPQRMQTDFAWLNARGEPLLSGQFREAHEQQPAAAIWALGAPLNTSWPSKGGRGQVYLPSVNVQEWARWLDQWLPSQPVSAQTEVGLPQRLAGWAERLDLTFPLVLSDGWVFRDVRISGGIDSKVFRAQVNSRQAKGQVDYEWPTRGQPQGNIHARMDFLSLEPLADPSASKAEPQRALVQPRNLPSIDLQVGQFSLKGRDYGALQLEAFNRVVERVPGLPANEWRFNRLWLDTPEAQLRAEGQWAPDPQNGNTLAELNRRSTLFNFTLDVKNSGALLARFGMKDVMRAAPGQVKGSLRWVGSPVTFDKRTLSGELALQLRQGQFLKAEPGIAKLLGVLSLQALPRRFLLDFRDVFNDGYRFDKLSGKAQIQQGVMSTSDLTLTGIQATVVIEGQADIVNETQDMKVLIVPQIDTNTIALLTAASNPVAGLVTFISQRLLKGVMKDMTSKTLHVTGSWSDPKVDEFKPDASRSNTQGGAR